VNQFPQAPEYAIMAVSNFFPKFLEILAAQGTPSVSRQQMEKIFNLKRFNYVLDTFG
jgi:hypothetical protein